jgi:phage shock protein E
MSSRFLAPVLFLLVASAGAADKIPNPLIDYDAFQKNVARVAELREQRRVTEAEFIRMAAEPGTVVLDARSAGKFAMLHVKGARNLSLPDITEEELAKLIPSKTTRILIYCNNNFLNAPEPFPTKALPASLNVYTFNVLHSYGYENVYELGPLLDIRETKLTFEGSREPVFVVQPVAAH